MAAPSPSPGKADGGATPPFVDPRDGIIFGPKRFRCSPDFPLIRTILQSARRPIS